MTGALHIGELRVSFQRYPRSQTGVVANPLRSWGALSFGPGAAGELLVPLADDEAVWLGLSAARPEIAVLTRIRVETAAGKALDAVTGSDWPAHAHSGAQLGLIVPPTRSADGIIRGDQTLAFTRVAAGDAPAAVTISLVAYPSKERQRMQETAESERLYALDDQPSGSPDSPTAIGRVDDGAWVIANAVSSRIALVDYRTFSARTGLPAPRALRADAPYGGWQLP